MTEVPAIRRVCLVLDVESYSVRDNRAQLEVQRNLQWVAQRGLTRAGIPVNRRDQQDRGDGLLLIMPQGLDESQALPFLIRGLRAAMHRVNMARGLGGRMRLRIALSEGIVQRARTGFVGRSVVLACRLLDSDQLRKALKSSPESDLAVIVPDDLYRDVFAHGYVDGSPKDFTPVEVSVPGKDFAASAWIWVPEPPRGMLRREAEALPLPSQGSIADLLASAASGVVAGSVGTLGAIEVVNAYHEYEESREHDHHSADDESPVDDDEDHHHHDDDDGDLDFDFDFDQDDDH